MENTEVTMDQGKETMYEEVKNDLFPWGYHGMEHSANVKIFKDSSVHSELGRGKCNVTFLDPKENDFPENII